MGAAEPRVPPWPWVAYQILLPLLAPLYLVYVFFRKRRRLSEDWLSELSVRLGWTVPSRPDFRKSWLWVHAASVGEILAARPLLRIFQRELPEVEILLSCSTATGLELARRSRTAKVSTLLPLDNILCLRALFQNFRPAALVLVETELWPGLLYMAGKYGTRLFLVNGRISSRGVRRYRWIRSLMRWMLSRFDLLCVRSQRDWRYFAFLGAPSKRLKVCGNLKFDSAVGGEVLENRIGTPETVPWEEACGWNGQRSVWLCVSTREGEEERLLQVYRSLKPAHPLLRLILVPRHPERCTAIEGDLLEGRHLWIRWSGCRAGPQRRVEPALPDRSRVPQARPHPEPECLLVDQVGILSRIYPRADLVFVGGSLVAHGGHNMLEAGAHGKPILFGPHTQNFRLEARYLQARSGALQVKDSADLQVNLERLLDDPFLRRRMGENAQRAVRSLSGASQRTWDLLSPALKAILTPSTPSS
ncbi:MAG: 3-deoxy-D-manno-octulosonic acid transferase [Elusimicrobia bacterium]|nr:3-deoxy-D-manno-octulosonic acid transferase [Elusimicrobiota bacterium]